MAPTKFLLATMGDLGDVAAQFAPIPGLCIAAGILCALIEMCENVATNKHSAAQLCHRCDTLLRAIRDSSASWTPDYMNSATRQAEILLQSIQYRMTRWTSKGRVASFIRQREITEDIERANGDVDRFTEKFQIASHFRIHQWQEEFRESQRLDHEELIGALSEISTCQAIISETQESQGLTLEEHGRVLHDIMELMQSMLQSVSAGDTHHSGLQRNLHQLQSQSGQLLPSMELKRGEVRRTGKNAVGGSAAMDIWEGLLLDEEKVSIKVIRAVHASEKNLARFQREVTVWRKLWEVDRGQYILPFYGYCQTDGIYPYLVSPWQPNGTAIDYVKRNPHIDHRKLVLNIARGVRVLHSLDVVHGDLKGANILINITGNPLIADFGLSKIVEDISGAPFTQSKGVSDSCRWFAAELLMGEATLTKASDIWAWAMTVLELMTGQNPFVGVKSNTEVVIRVYSGSRPERPQDEDSVRKGLDDELWKVLVRCWEAPPTQRPTVDEVIANLVQIWG